MRDRSGALEDPYFLTLGEAQGWSTPKLLRRFKRLARRRHSRTARIRLEAIRNELRFRGIAFPT